MSNLRLRSLRIYFLQGIYRLSRGRHKEDVNKRTKISTPETDEVHFFNEYGQVQQFLTILE